MAMATDMGFVDWGDMRRLLYGLLLGSGGGWLE